MFNFIKKLFGKAVDTVGDAADVAKNVAVQKTVL